MKHHKIAKLNVATAAQRTLPESTYFGFAVGADGVHSEYFVTLKGVTHLVTLGAPLVLDYCGVLAEPLIEPVRVLQHSHNVTYLTPDKPSFINSNQVHVIAFECNDEAKISVPSVLAPIVRSFVVASAGETSPTAVQMYLVPFNGRLSALFAFDGTPDDINIYGVSMTIASSGMTGRDDSVMSVDGPGEDSFEYELLDTASASGKFDIITQDKGAYDMLMIRLGDGTAVDATLRVRVI